MKRDSIRMLVEKTDIHNFVLNLWSDGPIKASHQSGSKIWQIVERFARLPRFFFEASDHDLEWTHFSTWWGAILLCDYDNPGIRDLRYLHEIYHAATLPYLRRGNARILEMKNFNNEREASCYTEMAIYLDLPDLRPRTFSHPLFVDRFLFPSGDLSSPDAALLTRWQTEPELVFDELMYERSRVILADEADIDANDPQIVWLRRYGEQGHAWVDIWSERFQLVEDAMLDMADTVRTKGRRAAADAHLEWLLSDSICDGSDIPFVREASAFRASFDRLITVYDDAMKARHQQAVRARDS